MSTICNCCINKSQCSEYGRGCRDNFIPSDDVRHYFQRLYDGRNYHYHFNTTSESLVNTHCMIIGYTHYCPYCGEKMYPIQDKKTLDVIGHCCICQGARDEIEYEAKRKQIKEKHDAEIAELNMEYHDKLAFCTDKLLEAKQQYDKRMIGTYRYSHLSTLNGRQYTNINQIVDR